MANPTMTEKCDYLLKNKAISNTYAKLFYRTKFHIYSIQSRRTPRDLLMALLLESMHLQNNREIVALTKEKYASITYIMLQYRNIVKYHSLSNS